MARFPPCHTLMMFRPWGFAERVYSMVQVLFIADDHELASSALSVLLRDGYKVRVSSSSSAVYDLSRDEQPRAVVVDLACAGPECELLESLSGLAPSSAVIVLVNSNESEKVVRAVRLGAIDFLAKPIDTQRLLSVLRRQFAEATEVEDPDAVLEEIDGDTFFLAASDSMKGIYAQVQRIGRVDVPVLITGESGTGKEIVAKLLHKYSPRGHKRFLKVNCAAIPDELLESELFGYEAGAFTGASRSKPGYFEQCNHGTILLDEIAEMPSRLQAKLLQVLQEGKFFRLGGKWPVEIDVRVLAATNIDTKQAVEGGKLRLDLFYRLNSFGIHIPPLRERKEEIAPLFREFVKRLSKKYEHKNKMLSESLLTAMVGTDWTGNVRELHNAARRFVLLGDSNFEVVLGNVVAPKPARTRHEFADNGGTLKQVVKEMTRRAEAEAIRNALEQTHGRRQEAADMLGICYKALVYKARRYGILGPSNREKKRLAKIAETGVQNMNVPNIYPETVRTASCCESSE